MQKLKGLLTLLTLIVSINANATHTLTYYVYYETEYVQGPWSRADDLINSNYKYLTPVKYDDAFGTVITELVNKMLSRLKENNPEFYNWTYNLNVNGDTVVISPKEKITHWETVKNEITATLTLNNFKAVIFQLEDGDKTLTINDITIPFLDLVKNPTEIIETTATDTVEINIQTNKEVSDVNSGQQKNPFLIWLIISGIINLVLIGRLILTKRTLKK